MMNHGMIEQYIEAAAAVHFARRRERVEALATTQALAERQKEIRSICAGIVGSFPDCAPLNVKDIFSLERDGYRVRMLTYQSLPGVITTANLYLPADRKPPWPGVVCVPGHFSEGKANAEYQRLAQLLARRGIAALLFDLVGQGERLEFYDATLRRSFIGKAVADEHTYLGNPMYLSGTHPANWMLWDAIRGLDVLIKYGDADAARLGATGAGAGGSLTRLLCCLEPRVSAAVLAADNLAPNALGGEDAEQNLFDAIPRGLNALDPLVTFAPKPLLLAYCAADKPAPVMDATVSELGRYYDLLKAKDRLGAFVADGPHGFTKEIRARAADHFARAFGLPDERIREHEIPTEPPEALYCTETGQVSNSLNTTSVFEYHRKLNQHLPPALAVPKDARGAKTLQDEIRDRFLPFLRMPEPAAAVSSVVESRSNDWGFIVEKGRLILDDMLYVPYSFYMQPEFGDSPGSRKSAPTVLALHERGIAGISKQGLWMTGFAAAGVHVLAIDVAGIGETRLQSSRDDSEPYEALLRGGEAQWARRAMDAGLNLFGLRVFSVLRTLSYLRTRWEVQRGAVSAVGVGRGALWALYAAALDGEVSRVALLRCLANYKSLLEHRRQNQHFSIFLPGCLQHFDLPHVAACIAPRPLTLINSVNQQKERCEAATLSRDYALTTEIYKLSGAASDFKIVNADSAPETLDAVKDTLISAGAQDDNRN